MFYLTTSRPYTNATPHLGTAIDVIYADCLNRFFKRLYGHTFWSMGTDEHSFKIIDKARKLGISPQTFVDQKYQEFSQIFNQMGVVADNFLQSSSPKHKWLANLAFDKLYAKNLIYKKSYQGLYCAGCEDFYAPSQLVDGKCPVHTNMEIQKVEEENYFFRLSSFKEHLLTYLGQKVDVGISTKNGENKEQSEIQEIAQDKIQDIVEELLEKKFEEKDLAEEHSHQHTTDCHHEDLDETSHEHSHSCSHHTEEDYQVFVPDESVLVEMRNFAQDLQDISISRQKSRVSTDWGVTIDRDPEHLMYVWFEALLTYLTPLIPDEIWQNYLDSDAEIHKVLEAEVWTLLSDNLPQNLQVIGRDNSKFHLIIWPAVLFGLDLEPIETCLVHGMITDNLGRKFAKSLGNGVNLEDFLEKVGMEGVRFFVLHDCNSVGDTAFDWQRVIESHNANLANNLGNLLSRVTNLVANYLDGFIDLEKFELENLEILKKTQTVELTTNKGEIENSTLEGWQSQTDGVVSLLNIVPHLVNFSNVYQNLFDLRPELAFQALLKESTKVNQFLEQTKPWSLAKNLEENKAQIEKILTLASWNLLEIGKVLSLFLPESGSKIIESLTQVKIQKAEVLFTRIELDK